jgi:hypothetical protein
MRKKLITLTLLAITANVSNGAKIKTNQLIHSDTFNKNWITINSVDENIQQQNRFKSCRIVRTSKSKNKHKKQDVRWKGSCLDFMTKYGSAKGDKLNKEWVIVISKDYDGITLEVQQQNKFKTCRVIKRSKNSLDDIVWSGACFEFIRMRYKASKFIKGWTTLLITHIRIQTHDKLSSYRIVDSVGDDSVGGVWTGSYDELLNEIEDMTRFKNKKYASFLHKQVQKHLHLPQLK